LLHLYLDESGTHRGSSITTIGGFVGTVATWASVEKKWLSALADCGGAPAYHAVDCEAGENDFAHIKLEIRQALARRLARELGDNDLLPVWSAVINEDWNAVATPAFRQKYPAPIYLCFAHIAARIAEWSERRGAKEPIAIVYAEQPEFQATVADIWRAYRQQKTRANLGSFTTALARQTVPLQAADMLAYEMNLAWQDREYGRFTQQFGEPPPLQWYERHVHGILREKLSTQMGGSTFGVEGLLTAMRTGWP
jgi:hypothetical protein